MVGGPPALQAALENGRIDAFVLSPPEAQIAAAGGYGRRPGAFRPATSPNWRTLPFLVLVARTPGRCRRRGPHHRAACAPCTAGSAAVQRGPARGSPALIQTMFFPRTAPAVVASAVEAMRGGFADGGRLSPAGIALAGQLLRQRRAPWHRAKATLWTNRYVAAAH